MNGIAAARWIFDADAVVEITFRNVVAQLSSHAAVLEALHNRVETTNLDRSFVAGEDRCRSWCEYRARRSSGSQTAPGTRR